MFFCFLIHAAVTYQNGPGGFVIAVTHAPEFGLLYFMTVDPTSQLMSQPANQHTYLFIILVSVGEMLHKRSKVGQILKY